LNLLVATARSQNRAEDFHWALEGEPVRLVETCDRDLMLLEEGRADEGCGCSRSFGGFSTMKSTTTALVIDSDLTRDDVVAALAGALMAAGIISPHPDDEELQDVQDEVDELLVLANSFTVGQVVRRHFDNVTAIDEA
jgi:hypothetical protein